MKKKARQSPGLSKSLPARIAIDLGADSCRVSLLRWDGERPRIAIIHRFSNGPVSAGGELRWNLTAIYAGLEEGLRRAAAAAPEGIASIAADGWAVDYVRLTEDGTAAAEPFCYRDSRTVAAEQAVHRHISPLHLYSLTGAQPLRFNTIYQLYADHLAGIPAQMPWINLAEYVLYRLGARRVAEYTNATHTGLVNAVAKTWCAEVFDILGLDPAAAPEIVPPGTDVGPLRGALAELPAFRSTRLIAAACHDTASAIAGIAPSGGGDAYISSGTWSLVGMLLDRPCATEPAYRKGFTNLGAAAGRICFHKNVNGMWLLRQCMEEWRAQGRDWSVAELIEKAGRLAPPDRLFDVDAEELLMPGNVLRYINRASVQEGSPPLAETAEDAPVIANLIFHSLAARYAQVLRDLHEITGKQIGEIQIVGGGSRNGLLNRLTEQATGLTVRCGAVESATLGNLAIQMAASERAPGAARQPNTTEISHWATVLESAGGESSA